jgi:hypothetical protein
MVALCLALPPAAPPAARAQPAAPTLTVNSFADVAPVAGTNLTDGVCETAQNQNPKVCTLRAAVMEANHYPGGGVTINLPAGTYPISLAPSGALTETVGDLNLEANMTLAGAGAAATAIDGNGVARVLCVAYGATVSLSGLTVRNGRVSTAAPDDGCPNGVDGGGILNRGALALDNVIVSGNRGRGGGGLMNQGSLTLRASVLAGNSAEGGGGIESSGPLLVLNSTLSNNAAVNSGGGLEVSGFNTPVLINATVAGNLADSGRGGYGYGGGVYYSDFYVTIKLRNTLLAYNYAGVTPSDCAGPLTSQDYNLIQAVPAGCTITGVTTHNITGVDPLLEPLADNGGATSTRALLAGSPALDKIPPGQCTDPLGAPLLVDQRGAPRPEGTGCDIGAYEGSVPAGFFGRNLVRNGDAESSTGSVESAYVGAPNWTVTGGQFTVWPYAVTGIADPANPGVPGAGANIFGGGHVSTDSGAVQFIALAPIAPSIDTGKVAFAFSAYAGGYADQDDRPMFDLLFLDDSNLNLLEKFIEGPTAAERGGVTKPVFRDAADLVPAGARSATVNAIMAHGANGGSYNNAYVDNVRLVLTPPATVSLAPPAQTIVAGSGGQLTATLSAAQAADTVVSLSSANAAVASVPPSVTIPMSQTSASFSVTGVSAGGPVAITATLPVTLGGGTATASVTVSSPTPTPTATPTVTPSPPASATPTAPPTPEGGTPRAFLPLLRK